MPVAVGMSEFSRFYSTDLGQELLAAEQSLLNDAIAQLVGYNCLQLSVGRGLRLGERDSVGHFVALGYAPGPERQDHVWADYQNLPVVSDCADIVLLHHVLEFSREPTQLLREANRTLSSGGYMLIVGFNPFSAWPLYNQYRQWKSSPIKSSPRSIRQGRINDWLAVLNYEILQQQRLFFRLPFNSKSWLSRTRRFEAWGQRLGWPFGMVYLTLARKRAFPVNPLRSRGWRQSLSPQRQPAQTVRFPVSNNGHSQ